MFALSPGATGSGRAVAGFLLALIGILLESLPALLSYYLFRSNLSLVEYSQIVESLSISGFLLLGVGLFLLLRELVSRLPVPPAYLHVTPIIVLLAALFQVGVGAAYLLLLPALYGSPSIPPIPEDVFTALQVGSWIADFAAGASVLLTIFGTVRALTVRPGPPVFPPPP